MKYNVMNKLTPNIKYLLNTTKYRGLNLFQQTRLTDNVEFLVCFLSTLRTYTNGMTSKCNDVEITELVKKLYGFKGVSCYGIRKNLFPDLEKLKFIKRSGRGKNWDKVHITQYGIEFLDESDNFKKKTLIETAYRRYRKEVLEFSEFMNRLEILVTKYGELVWWEIWMCMRLDIDFNTIIDIAENIRKKFKIKRNIHKGIDEVTKLFLEHNVKSKKKNGSIDFGNIINKVTSFGTKATFFFFSVSGSGRYMTFKGQFDTSINKAQRTYKRDPYYIINGNDKGLEYHHVVPFENVHYNLQLHEQIDSLNNLLPISVEDHAKFPKTNNQFVKMKIENSKIRFYNLLGDNYIEIVDDKHLNIKLLKQEMINFNKKLVEKVF